MRCTYCSSSGHFLVVAILSAVCVKAFREMLVQIPFLSLRLINKVGCFGFVSKTTAYQAELSK